MSRWRRLLPPPEKLRDNRWLRWLGPSLFHPHLWHVHRRGIALGMAVGVFFGLLIPIAQIPFSAAAAVLMRANVPAAVASTLVTNPVTFGPVYYAAWRVGSAILGEPVAAGTPPPKLPSLGAEVRPHGGAWAALKRSLLGIGKPLLLGLAIFASVVGLATYLSVSWAWRVKILWRRRQRRRAATVAVR
jgi:uncharacterized protein (DUF2062 family)